MLNKRSQITFFIIIGVIILVIIGVYLTMSKSAETSIVLPNKKVNSDYIEIQNYVEDCLKESIIENIYVISMSGGHIKDPIYDDINDPFNVAIYSNGLEKILPSLSYIQNQLSNAVENNVMVCIDDFSIFKKQGMDISYSTPKVSSIIGDNKITTNMQLIVNVNSKTFTNFDSVDNFEFKFKYNLVEKIIDRYIHDEGAIDLVYLERLSSQNNFKYEIVPLENSQMVFSLIFDKEIYELRPFIYNFKVRLPNE